MENQQPAISEQQAVKPPQFQFAILPTTFAGTSPTKRAGLKTGHYKGDRALGFCSGRPLGRRLSAPLEWPHV